MVDMNSKALSVSCCQTVDTEHCFCFLYKKKKKKIRLVLISLFQNTCEEIEMQTYFDTVKQPGCKMLLTVSGKGELKLS